MVETRTRTHRSLAGLDQTKPLLKQDKGHSRGRGKEECQQQNHNVKGNTCEGGRGRSEGRVRGLDASTARLTWKGKKNDDRLGVHACMVIVTDTVCE